MMRSKKTHGYSRREREIMDILHRLGRATPAEVREALPEAPGYTAVNTLLRILMEAGQIGRAPEGRQFVYFPTQARRSAARDALYQVVQTFFGGSVEQAVTTLLSEGETGLTDEELARLADVVARAKEAEPVTVVETEKETE